MQPELKKFFEVSPDKQFIIFTGDRLDIFINERYESNGCLALENGVVRTLGIFDMLFNETTEAGFLVPAIIKMQPSLTEKITDGKFTYLKATFLKGDIFMGAGIVKNPQLLYVMYYEFIYVGAQPKFLTYDTIFSMFDTAGEITGSALKVSHTIFEILYAYPYRCANDIRKQYRLSDRKKPPVFIPMREVAHITSSTVSKLVGSYFGSAIDAALVNEADQPTELEQLLRK